MVLPERIAQKIALEGECWAWTGAHIRGGYGQVRFDGKPQSAHRVVYELLVGPIPNGLEIDHLCRNRSCVNPAHLEPVTHDENMARSARATQTHCVHGHPLTDDNIYQEGKARKCRVCRKARGERFRERARESARLAA